MPRNLPQRRSNSTKLPNKRPSNHFRHRSFGEVVPVGSLEEDPVGIALEEGLAGSNHLAVRPEEDIEVRRSHLGVDRRVVDYRRNIESLTCCWFMSVTSVIHR